MDRLAYSFIICTKNTKHIINIISYIRNQYAMMNVEISIFVQYNIHILRIIINVGKNHTILSKKC